LVTDMHDWMSNRSFRAGRHRRDGAGRALLVLVLVLFSGCTQLIIRTAAPSLIPKFTASIFEECDPDLAKDAIPSNLKLMEGLLRSDPRNKEILLSLSMGFAGYSLLFVETEDPERASRLYLRARAYGLQSLGEKGKSLVDPAITRERLRTVLNTISERDYEALFWTTLSWNAWISLNLDQPAALSQMAAAEACLKRVLEMDPLYMHGLPHVLMGVSLSARPPLLGGNPREALAHFESALQHNGGKFFLTQVYFARYYAVRVQDKALFDRLLEEATTGYAGELKDVCLINRVMQQRANHLKKQTDDFFI
jgi:tetratricopeptide (TPR) repeat protein